MTRLRKQYLMAAGVFLLLFMTLTLALTRVDVQAVGPRGSAVGLASINGWWAEHAGVRWLLYEMTDWLGLGILAVAFGFAFLGLAQLVCRRSLLKVDPTILLLGLFYLLVFGAYALFEFWVINYRPVLIDGFLEASYPSSTTLLSLCVLGSAIPLWQRYISNSLLQQIAMFLSILVLLFAVTGRVLSGVHWLTDIVGGILLSGFFVTLYLAGLDLADGRARKRQITEPHFLKREE